jgi:hypothetical protein
MGTQGKYTQAGRFRAERARVYGGCSFNVFTDLDEKCDCEACRSADFADKQYAARLEQARTQDRPEQARAQVRLELARAQVRLELARARVRLELARAQDKTTKEDVAEKLAS